MSKNAAKEADLGVLHAKVAQVMTRAIVQIEQAQDMFDKHKTLFEALPDEDKTDMALMEPPSLSAPLMGVMTKFLSDNSITCAPEASTEMSGLARTLHEREQRRNLKLAGDASNVVELHG